MNAAHWRDVISRIILQEATDIDDLTGQFDDRRNPSGCAIFPTGVQSLVDGVPFKDESMAAIGCRITEKREDIVHIALSLATLAMEKEIEVVIFNHVDYCGLERFGFRCERITGDTPEEKNACEEQVRRYWGIDYVI